MKETKLYLDNLIKDNDVCLLALSGGPDSMALLDLLIKEKEKKDIKVIALHVNHGTRKENESEYLFIKDYLRDKDVTLEYFQITDYKNNKFSEEEGRNKRYKFFRDMYEKYNGTYIFTAHHADDQVETILMRILRGSTLEGYAGIRKDQVWDGIRFVRPLLTCTKKMILEYNKENNIPYVVDQTNFDTTIPRNKIRAKILPILEELNPKYYEKFSNYSKEVYDASVELAKITSCVYKDYIEDGIVSIYAFLGLSLTMQKYFLRYYLKNVYQSELYLINDTHINNIINLLTNDKKTASLNLPRGYTLEKERGFFKITKNTGVSNLFKIPVSDNTYLYDDNYLIKLKTYEDKSNYEIHLNSKDITLPLYVVNRYDGMRIKVKNLNGSKKVNDILIDAKVPNSMKDSVPILIDSKGEVLWVLGIKKSKYDIEKDGVYDIIYKYKKKGMSK